ncbi:MAG: hypothetical protein AB9903_22655 [Vulcanimicrobiota bacterium]
MKERSLFHRNHGVIINIVLLFISLFIAGPLCSGCTKTPPGAASGNFSPQTTSPEENASEDYQKAIVAVNSSTVPAWMHEAYKLDKFTDLQNKYIDDHQKVITAILTGDRKLRSEFFKSTPDFKTKMPHLLNLRAAANITLADAHRFELKGQYKECVEREIAVYRMGTRLAEPHATLLCSLVGVAIRTLAVEYMFNTVNQNKCSEELLKKMAHELSVIDASMPSVLAVYKGEYEMLKLSAYTCPPHYKNKKRLEDYVNRLTEANKQLYADLTPSFEKYDGEGAEKVIIKFREPLEKKYKTHLDREENIKALMSQCPDCSDAADLLILSAYISLRKTTCHFYITRMNGLALQVLAAAEAFKKRTGEYPETLREACDEAGIAPPPADPITGKAISYKVSNGAVIVWGAGLDGIDNGGVEPKTPVNPAAGSDLVYKSGSFRPHYGLR